MSKAGKNARECTLKGGSMFKHEITEKSEAVSRKEYWTAEIDGYDVIGSREDGFSNHFQLAIAPTSHAHLRLPLLQFYPKNISDLERLATILPSLLTKVANGLKEQGLSDLRSNCDIMEDNMKAKFQAIRKRR